MTDISKEAVESHISFIRHNKVYVELEDADREAYEISEAMLIAQAARQYDQNCEQIIYIAELEAALVTARTDALTLQERLRGDKIHWLTEVDVKLEAVDALDAHEETIAALVEALITAERELQDAADYWDELCNDGARAPFTVAAKEAQAALAALGKEPT